MSNEQIVREYCNRLDLIVTEKILKSSTTERGTLIIYIGTNPTNHETDFQRNWMIIGDISESRESAYSTIVQSFFEKGLRDTFPQIKS